MIALLLAWILQPDSEALLRLYRQAYEQHVASAGKESTQAAASASDLGLYLRNLGRTQEAATYLELALQTDERVLGPSHPKTITEAENLASVAPPVRALALWHRVAASPDPATAARALSQLAQREPSRAAEYLTAALERERQASGKQHPRVAARLNDLALVLPPDKAEALLREALAMQTSLLGPDHPDTATTQNNLGNVLLAMGHPREASELLRQSLNTLESAVGPVHARTATACSNLADALAANRQTAEAIRLYRRALAIDEAVFGKSDKEVAVDLRKLAEALPNGPESKRLRERAAQIERAP